jgi:hypothetical protein
LILHGGLTRFPLPTKNIENNPMQRNRAAAGTRYLELPLTRRANQWHFFIITQFGKLPVTLRDRALRQEQP